MEQNALLTQLEGAINLVSMMPPSRLKKNLVGLVKIAPEIEDNLYEKVLLPMCTCLIYRRNQPVRIRAIFANLTQPGR